ncbi:MAG: GNAT family N-acetyltransferase [Nocardioidaceae bacterium]|nr:GNAT family N-acetyltransferase [Nocardioidaceae bacterium]
MIRPGTPEDVADLGALEVELFGTGAWSPDDLIGMTGADRWVRVTTDQAGRLAGYVVTTMAGEVVDLLRIGVRTDHQRRGLGGILLAAALDAAAELPEAERMMLEVSEANAAATALYLGHGFAVIDRRRRYYPDGTDALVMERSLRA